MKFLGVTLLIVALVLGAAYLGGVFEAKVEVIVNEDLKDDTVEFTYDTLEKTKESTDRVFNTLKEKLEEMKKDDE